MARKFLGKMTNDEVFGWLNADMPLEERYAPARLLSEYVEIPKETYWYFLEVLPPVQFNGRRFGMLEATTGDIRLGLFKINDRYFAAHVSDFQVGHRLAEVEAEIAKLQLQVV